MFAAYVRKRSNKSEGESPFWISFADLMTALMTLFLVVMAVTLISITQSIPKTVEQEAIRQQDIKIVMGLLNAQSKPFEKVRVDESNFRIDLGEIVRFDSASSTISPEAGIFLRSYIPVLLAVKKHEQGRWIKRYVIEGFTDQDGSYTYNLRLSLDRSLNVICSLIPKTGSEDSKSLTQSQLREIQALFLVGGFSFNSIMEDKAASRRVELKVEFWGLGEKENADKKPMLLNRDFGSC